MAEPGRVRIVVKSRALQPLERQSARLVSQSIFCEKSNAETMLIIRDKPASKIKCYRIDEFYDEDVSVKEIYSREISPLVQLALCGYNVCVFALGIGCSDKAQVISDFMHSTATDILNCGFELAVSYYQIFMDKCYDLLHSEGALAHIPVMEDANGRVHLRGLKNVRVFSSDEFSEILFQGRNKANPGKSRNSHGALAPGPKNRILTMNVKDKGSENFGKINFVDLVAFRPSTNTRPQPQGSKVHQNNKMNQPINALQNVIHAINSKTPRVRVPFRDCKLTRILQDSMVGKNSASLMIGCIIPSSAEDCVFTMNLITRTCTPPPGLSKTVTSVSASTPSLSLKSSSSKPLKSTPVTSLVPRKNVTPFPRTPRAGKNPPSVSTPEPFLSLKKMICKPLQSTPATTSHFSLKKDAGEATDVDDVGSNSDFIQKRGYTCMTVAEGGDKKRKILCDAEPEMNKSKRARVDDYVFKSDSMQEHSLHREQNSFPCHVRNLCLQNQGSCECLSKKHSQTHGENHCVEPKFHDEVNMQTPQIHVQESVMKPQAGDSIMTDAYCSPQREEVGFKATGEEVTANNIEDELDKSKMVEELAKKKFPSGIPGSLSYSIRQLQATLEKMSRTSVKTEMKMVVGDSVASFVSRVPAAASAVETPKSVTPLQILASPSTRALADTSVVKSAKCKTPLQRLYGVGEDLKKSLEEEYVNFLNNADVEELVAMRGIGAKRANHILKLRQEQGGIAISRISDLEQIGMTPKQIKSMLQETLKNVF